jgi:hypothetical protein
MAACEAVRAAEVLFLSRAGKFMLERTRPGFSQPGALG